MAPAPAKLTYSISQYYSIAACTILFYDYLLTLSDEARQLYFARILRPLLRPRFVKDQICLVWKEIVECANPRMMNTGLLTFG